MILRKTYPGVDVRTARSRLIDENRMAAGDVAIARAARDAIAAARMAEDHPELARDPVLIDRAAKLQAFFSQPFYVAEPYTERPGSHVSRTDALRGCREILEGQHDDLPVEAFYFTGSIEEIRRGSSAA
jgi:F-type H+/Na+-transporting ATPase subunit beta